MFHNLQVKGLVVEQQSRASSCIFDANCEKGVKKEVIEREGTYSCSPNSPNSANTRSSFINGGGFAMQDLEGLSFGGEGSLLPWIMGQVDDPNLTLKNLLGFDGYNGIGTSISGVENYGNFSGKVGGGGGLGFSGFDCNVEIGEQFRICDDKPQIVNPQFGFGEQNVQTIQNPNNYLGSFGYSQVGLDHSFVPPVKTPNFNGFGLNTSVVQVPRGALLNKGHEGMFMSLSPQQHLQKSMNQDRESLVSDLRDQLIKVSEMFQTGNFALTQVILARLNHQASLPGNPLVGVVALYVKLELEKLLSMNGMPTIPSSPKSLSLDGVINKISAYKLFSEVSPIMQFVDFTCTQALLEALDDADTIHVLDFDIGCGSMWASFIRELPLRKKGTPFLKITVLASTSSHHPFELALICDNILEFATEFGVSVDIKVLNLDLFDSSSCTFPGFHLLENEVVAIKFPIWACSHCPFLLPSLLSFMKQCSPKILISFDQGGNHYDLAFPSHILQCLNSCYSILESLNGSSVSAEIISRIEKFLIRPSIERTIQGRIQSPGKMQVNKMYRWKDLFSSAGFVPSTFSNFAEYQAHELVNKLPVNGFNVENRQASIILSWQSHELVAGLAWSC